MKKWEGNLEMKRNAIASRVGRRVLSLLLSVVMVVGMVPTMLVPSVAASTLSLAQLKEKYPHGSKWYSSFDGSKECAGFARLLCYEAYGSEYYINNNGNWKKVTDQNYIDNGLKAGDLVRYKNNGHSVFITGVHADTVSIADCNSDYACTVKWRDIEKASLKNGFTHAYSAPYALDGAPDPEPQPDPTPDPPPSQERSTTLSVWISDTPMGNTPSHFEANQTYYLCYELYDAETNEPYNSYVSGSYSVTETLYDSSGASRGAITYTNSDGNYVSITPDAAGMWKGSVNVPEIDLGCDYTFRVRQTQMRVWTSDTKYGASKTSFDVGERVYLCYRIFDAGTNELYDTYSDKDYTATMELYNPGGQLINTETYNDDESWISSVANTAGKWKGRVTIAGELDFGEPFEKEIEVSEKDTGLDVSIAAVDATYTIHVFWNELPEADHYSVVLLKGLTVVDRIDDYVYTVHNFKNVETGTYSVYLEAYDSSGNILDGYLSDDYTIHSYSTITYDANGGSGAPAKQTKDYGVSINLSSTKPTKAGYTFKNWKAPDGSTYNAGATFSSNESVTLTAQWTPNTYIIKYNSNGGSGSMSNSTHTYDTAKALSANAFTRSGYTFLGWATSSSAASATYTDKQSVKNLTSTNGGTVNLYAVWKAETPQNNLNPWVLVDNYNYVIAVTWDAIANADYYVVQIWNEDLILCKSYEDHDEKLAHIFYEITSGNYRIVVAAIDCNGDQFATSITDYYSMKSFSKITYDANGGSGAPSTQTKKYGSNATISSTKPTKSGYTFLGWSTNKNATSYEYKSGDTYSDEKDLTLYAVWSATPKYTVSYNANGGSGAPSSQTKTHDVTLTLSSTKPAKTGYTFQGWATSSSGSVLYASGANYSSNSSITLYAVWKANTYSVKYNANGGSGSMSNSSHTYDTSKALSQNAFARNGYTFLGWATSSSATSAVYTDKQSVKNLTSENGGTVNLYAVWSATPKYTVSYNANGGTGAPANQTKTKDVALTLSSTEPTKTGYEFKGWATSSDGSVAYTAGATYTSNSAITLYAVWQANTYAIKYNANGGSGSMPNSTHTYDTAKALSANAFTRSGYTFLGWSTSSSATSATYTDKQSVKNLTSANGGTVNLYAVWSATPKYTVSYNANGGTGAPASQTKTKDITLTLSSTQPTRTGYRFKGWATSSSGNAVYAAGATYSSNSAITLFAVWEANKYTVTYNANGGSGTMAASSHTYDAAKALTKNAFTKTGYTFAGWSTSASGTVAYTDGQSVKNLSGVNGGNVTLYAVWASAEKYTITFDCKGGTVISPGTKTHGVDWQVLFHTPTKTGYTFVEWRATDGTVYAPGSMYTANESTTLTAQWSAITYKVKFDANGGEGSMGYNLCRYDSENSLDPNEFERDGYEFVGWALSPDATRPQFADREKVLNLAAADGAIVLLYAVWEKVETYEIEIWIANEEEIDEVVLNLQAGEIIDLGEYKPKQTGYTFIAWWDFYADKSYSPNDKFVVSKDTLLVSGMQANTYIVNFDAQGGVTTEELKSVKFDSAYGALPVPTRNGYDFDGWYTKPTGGDLVTAETIVSTPDRHTLYARWSQQTQTISPVTVTLDKTSVSLQVGGTATLSATVAPENATNKSVTWTSTNETVATVANGVVTAHAAGITTITATTVDGAKTATCLVTVEEQNDSYDAYVYTEAKKSVVQGSQFTFKVYLAGTYDGYSFALVPADGLSIVNIAAAGSGIYIDEQADRWLISVLGGLGKSEAEKEEIVTVTVQVDADAQLGARELALSNVMISNDLGDKVSSVKYEYASIEITDQIPGDINGDEVFDYYDVSKLFAFYRNKTTLDESIDTDINGDGTFDYYDVSKLFAIYRGKATFN